MDAQPGFHPTNPSAATAPVEATLAVGGGRRLALTPLALHVEVRNGRDWRIARTIGYGEIAAAYRYEVRDWGYLGLGLVYGLVLLAAVLSVALLSGLDGVLAGGVAALVVILVIGLTAYRIATVPRRWLRIETHTGPLLLPNRDELFFNRLSTHLSPPLEPVELEAATQSAPAPAAIPPAPAPPP